MNDLSFIDKSLFDMAECNNQNGIDANPMCFEEAFEKLTEGEKQRVRDNAERRIEDVVEDWDREDEQRNDFLKRRVELRKEKMFETMEQKRKRLVQKESHHLHVQRKVYDTEVYMGDNEGEEVSGQLVGWLMVTALPWNVEGFLPEAMHEFRYWAASGIAERLATIIIVVKQVVIECCRRYPAGCEIENDMVEVEEEIIGNVEKSCEWFNRVEVAEMDKARRNNGEIFQKAWRFEYGEMKSMVIEFFNQCRPWSCEKATAIIYRRCAGIRLNEAVDYGWLVKHTVQAMAIKLGKRVREERKRRPGEIELNRSIITRLARGQQN